MVIKELKEHTFYLLGLIIVILIYYSFFLTAYDTPPHDLLTGYFPHGEVLKQSMTNYNDFFPLWNPYWFSGTPFLGNPGTLHIGSITYFLILIFPSTILALKINFILDIILMAITMYILMIYLTNDKMSAFISAFIFTFSGYVVSTFATNWLTSLNAYPFMPLILLLTMLSFKSRNWIFLSIITGILFALQIFGGPDLKVVLFSIIIFILYAITYIFGKNMLQRIVKAFLISCIVGIVLFGITAARILPEKEYLESTGRSNLPYEQAASRVTPIKDIFSNFIEPIYDGFPKIQRSGLATNIGLIAFVLVCIGVYKNWKRKIVLMLLAAMLISVLIATGSFLFYLLWRYIPPWSGFRYLSRAIILFVFSASILAGFGALEIFKMAESKYKNRFNRKISFFIITALVIANLLVLGPSPRTGNLDEWRNIDEAIKDSGIFQEIKKDGGVYRVHVFETNGIDWPTTYITVPIGLEDIYGYQGAWSIDYFNIFLGIANYNPAKLWGILNVKYITSTTPLNISGFEYVGKFPCGPNCYNITPLEKAKGPYLYKNSGFMPRALIVNKSLLILGPLDYETQQKIIYPLLLDDRFDPNNEVILLSDKLPEDISLKKYDAILLSGQPSQTTINELKKYVENGGHLFPDIFSGNNNYDLDKLFSILNGSYSKEIAINRNSFEGITLKFEEPATGWLVYSETFSLYPGWYALEDGKNIPILRADGIISAIPLEKSNNIEFRYSPKSVMIGKIISIFTLVLILSYLSYKIFKK